MRADRLLRLLALLQRHRRVRAVDLARQLEVSERTVLRDMEALSAAGVPVYTERGRGGGCVLMDGFTTDASGLTTAEAQALFAWTSRDRAKELGMASELSGALAKVAASVPAQAVTEAEALGAVLLSDRRRWFSEAERVPTLPLLRKAAAEGRRVRMSYESVGAPAKQRIVDPHGLVDNSGRWYLIASHRGRLRTYRVSRVRSVTVLAEPVRTIQTRPLEELWAQLRSSWEEQMPAGGTTITVRVAPEIARLFLGIVGSQLAPETKPLQVGPAQEHTWQLSVRAHKAALALVLGWAPQVVLLDPPDLLDDVRRATAVLTDLYATR